MSAPAATALHVREARPEDAPRLWELLAQGLAGYGLAPDPDGTDTDMADVGASYLARGGRFRVLVDGDRIIGMYGLYRVDDATVELRKMYLEPAMKGRGHGRRLMEEALRLAREAGYRRMVLETNRRLVEAIGMYRKFGFTEEVRPDRSPRCDAAMAMDL